MTGYLVAGHSVYGYYVRMNPEVRAAVLASATPEEMGLRQVGWYIRGIPGEEPSLDPGAYFVTMNVEGDRYMDPVYILDR